MTQEPSTTLVTRLVVVEDGYSAAITGMDEH